MTQDKSSGSSASGSKDDGKTRFGFSWWMKNLLIAAAVYMLCPSLVKSNAGYQWAIEGYCKSNLQGINDMKAQGLTSPDQILESRLGYDYAFIEMIRKSTPENAIVFYPSREDFTATAKLSGVPFSGNLCDKLAAVRFLYPRHVVVKEELGHTSWSRRLTHVAILGNRWRQLLPYKLPQSVMISVLPTDSVAASRMIQSQQ